MTKEERSKYNKARYQKHRTEIKARNASPSHKERRRKYNKEYGQLHAEEAVKRAQKWNDDHRKDIQKYQRFRRYGLTEEQFLEYLITQEGKCAICAVPFGKTVATRCCVDHCHTTGRVRGLLCTPCNSAIGLFGDNRDKLSSAIKYLKNATR